MTRWTVAADGRDLRRDGAPTMLLADTVWNAFAGPTDAEWAELVARRARQGFTGVLVSAGPLVHETGERERMPWPPAGDGADPRALDLDRLDDEYFARAARMLRLAAAAGLTPVVVLLWNSYVPGTWGARLTPSLVLDDERRAQFVDRCLAEFAPTRPIWIVSGDDHFANSAVIARYRSAAEQVRRADPGSLIGFHTGSSTVLDAALVDELAPDLHVFQSGHHQDEWRESPRRHARHYLGLQPRRPILNLEPAYEGHGRGDGAARHSAADVRAASWLGVLCGAGAGLGYGAHGVWSWHRRGEPFGNTAFAGVPYPATVAVGFPGAWDAGFLRELVERHALTSLAERSDVLVGDRSGAVVGGDAASGTLAVFAPQPFDLELAVPPGRYRVTGYELAARRAAGVRHERANDGMLRVALPDFVGDALHVIERED